MNIAGEATMKLHDRRMRHFQRVPSNVLEWYQDANSPLKGLFARRETAYIGSTSNHARVVHSGNSDWLSGKQSSGSWRLSPLSEPPGNTALESRDSEECGVLSHNDALISDHLSNFKLKEKQTAINPEIA
ncbi:hypothetical protein VTO42DRAFT_8005 [Malbranchea cinnamomea]